MRALVPAPDLSFTEVVEIQLTALANDNANNDGIALAYRFAAPSNKREVGPLERFITLFDTELYAPMLNRGRPNSWTPPSGRIWPGRE